MGTRALAAFVIAGWACASAFAQTTYFPPPGVSYNATTHQIGTANLQPPGANTQIPYNSSGTLAATGNLTWLNSTNVLNVGASNTPGTVSIGQLDAMVVNGATVPVPAFAVNSNIQGVIENHSYIAGGPTGGARYYGVRSRGTITSPAIVQNGDNLSTHYAAGYNGTNYSLAGYTRFLVNGTPGATAMPADWVLALSPAGSQTPAEVIHAYTTGALAINGSQGTSGQVLTSGGTGAATWSSVSFTGTSGSIGGGALAAGACATGTAAVTGANTGMVANANPNTYPGDGIVWQSYVSSGNTVTVKVCAIVALTPTASTYNVRVLP